MFIFDVLNSVPIVIPVAILVAWNIILHQKVEDLEKRLKEQIERLEKRTVKLREEQVEMMKSNLWGKRQ